MNRNSFRKLWQYLVQTQFAQYPKQIPTIVHIIEGSKTKQYRTEQTKPNSNAVIYPNLLKSDFVICWALFYQNYM